ncbi:hypothetical protein JW698_01870 [Candidatus Wolfebacteria bacterium]|nr:hypothetical protein [Candidatus Wolfebacteria bacterium]
MNNKKEKISATLFFTGFLLIMTSIGTIEASIALFPLKAIIIGIAGMILIFASILFFKKGEKNGNILN